MYQNGANGTWEKQESCGVVLARDQQQKINKRSTRDQQQALLKLLILNNIIIKASLEIEKMVYKRHEHQTPMRDHLLWGLFSLISECPQ